MAMSAERTFWEKATAAHVYSLQGRLRGERYSRHWYDMAAMVTTGHAAQAAGDQQLARAVAEHKSIFFDEKDSHGSKVDYLKAVNGGLRMVPAGGVPRLGDGGDVITLQNSCPDLISGKGD